MNVKIGIKGDVQSAVKNGFALEQTLLETVSIIAKSVNGQFGYLIRGLTGRSKRVKRINLYDDDGNLIPDPCLIDDVHKMLVEYKVTIRATASERLIITDEVSGEEYVVDNLGYPF